MPTGAASHDAHILEVPELLLRDLHVAQKHLAVILRYSAEQRVSYGPRLFENLFLHEMLVAAFFRHDRVPSDLVRGPLDRLAIEIGNTNAIPREYCDIAIREKENVARVLQQCRNVAGHEVFAVSQADHGRRSDSGGHELLGVVSREKHQRINAP